IIVPQRIENLFVAGRCASMSHEGQSSARVSGACFVMGQAAGTAADLALTNHLTPREVDVRALQRELERNGAFLGPGAKEAARAAETSKYPRARHTALGRPHRAVARARPLGCRHGEAENRHRQLVVRAVELLQPPRWPRSGAQESDSSRRRIAV